MVLLSGVFAGSTLQLVQRTTLVKQDTQCHPVPCSSLWNGPDISADTLCEAGTAKLGLVCAADYANTARIGTSLHHASYRGSDDVVQALLSCAADKDQWLGSYPVGTPLMWAAEGGWTRCVHALVKHKAKVNEVFDGTTALVIASSRCSLKIVEELLGVGATHCVGNPLSAAVDAGCGSVSVVLLSRGASGEGIDQGKFRNVIHEGMLWALEERPLEERQLEVILGVGSLDQAWGADLSPVDLVNLPLEAKEWLVRGFLERRSAVGETSLYMANYLLQYGGVSCNIRDTHNRTVVAIAIGAEMREIVNVCLDAGADFGAVASTSDTALIYAMRNLYTDRASLARRLPLAIVKGKNSFGQTALTIAMGNMDAKGVDALLDAGADDWDVVLSGGNAALKLCAELRRARCVEQLLKRGLDPNALLLHNQTPLFFAGNAAVVHVMLEFGANMDHQDAFGDTALIGSAKAHRLAVFGALLGRGANASIKNAAGNSAWNWLRESDNYDGMKFKDMEYTAYHWSALFCDLSSLAVCANESMDVLARDNSTPWSIAKAGRETCRQVYRYMYSLRTAQRVEAEELKQKKKADEMRECGDGVVGKLAVALTTILLLIFQLALFPRTLTRVSMCRGRLVAWLLYFCGGLCLLHLALNEVRLVSRESGILVPITATLAGGVVIWSQWCNLLHHVTLHVERTGIRLSRGFCWSRFAAAVQCCTAIVIITSELLQIRIESLTLLSGILFLARPVLLPRFSRLAVAAACDLSIGAVLAVAVSVKVYAKAYVSPATVLVAVSSLAMGHILAERKLLDVYRRSIAKIPSPVEEQDLGPYQEVELNSVAGSAALESLGRDAQSFEAQAAQDEVPGPPSRQRTTEIFLVSFQVATKMKSSQTLPTKRKQSSKFSVFKLEFGRGSVAALGLDTAIGLTDDVLLAAKADPLRAMEDEVRRYGTLDDLANYLYIVYGTSLNYDDIPAHVKESLRTGSYHGGSITPADFDTDHGGRTLHDWMQLQEVRDAALTEPEFVAVRFYTSSSYPRYNNPLRDREVHPWRLVVHYLDRGVKKLRASSAKDGHIFQEERDLWRGMKDVDLDIAEFQFLGGTELAPMSTSANRDRARSYACSTVPLMFKYKVSGLSAGVPIKFLSLYPGEEEYLYPPLTFLRYLEHYIDDDMLVVVVSPQMS